MIEWSRPIVRFSRGREKLQRRREKAYGEEDDDDGGGGGDGGRICLRRRWGFVIFGCHRFFEYRISSISSSLFFFFGSLCTFLWFHRCHLFFCFFFSLSLFVVAQEVWVGGRHRPRRLSTGTPFLFPSNRNRGWCLLLDLELNCTGSTWFVVFCLSIFLGVFSHWEPKKIQSCFV